MIRSRPNILALTIGVASLVGCGVDYHGVVFPVEGRLAYDGEPMEGAVVMFHPADTSQAVVRRAHGTADARGEFHLTTYSRDDGAPPGEYIVTIYWPAQQATKSAAAVNANDREDSALPPDQLRGTFADPRASKLHATVDQEPTRVDFTLP